MIGDYLIENVFREGLINVVVGASGSGKTTWVLQAFETMATGKPFLERFAIKVPLLPTHYVSLERHKVELEDKFRRIHIPRDFFTWTSYRNKLKTTRPSTIFMDMPEGTQILVIDGIGFIVDKIISQREVGLVLSEIANLSEQKGVTPIIIHHTAKAKGNMVYDNPREKGSGSGAWAQMASNSVIIEKVGEFEDPTRQVWICQASGKDLKMKVEMTDEGRLIPSREETVEEQDLTLSILDSVHPGTQFDSAELLDRVSCSRATFFRHLEQLVESGVVRKIQRGIYERRG